MGAKRPLKKPEDKLIKDLEETTSPLWKLGESMEQASKPSPVSFKRGGFRGPRVRGDGSACRRETKLETTKVKKKSGRSS